MTSIDIYQSPIQPKCSCLICKQETTSSHLYKHTARHTLEKEYALSSKRCQCGNIIPFKTKNNTFCSIKCHNFYQSTIRTTFKFNASIVHNNKYDYCKSNIVNAKTPIVIICPIHGDFSQLPHTHLSGHGCQKCGLLSQVYNYPEESRELAFKNSWKFKNYIFPSGENIKLQGYENHAYDYLISIGHVFTDFIINKPRFKYAFENKIKIYHPDIMLINNKVIQVKSTYTIKLDNTLYVKRAAMLSYGFDYEIWVIEPNNIITVTKADNTTVNYQIKTSDNPSGPLMKIL